MPAFLKKKEETVDLAELREADICPACDWRLAVTVFVGVVLAACAVTIYVFYTMTKSDVADAAATESENAAIDAAKLQKAADYILSRTQN